MFRFIYLFIFFQSFSQNQYLENGNRNGPWKGYYDNGQIRYEGTFDDGKEIGLFKYYYRSGNLEKEFFTPKVEYKLKLEFITLIEK